MQIETKFRCLPTFCVEHWVNIASGYWPKVIRRRGRTSTLFINNITKVSSQDVLFTQTTVGRASVISFSQYESWVPLQYNPSTLSHVGLVLANFFYNSKISLSPVYARYLIDCRLTTIFVMPQVLAARAGPVWSHWLVSAVTVLLNNAC